MYLVNYADLSLTWSQTSKEDTPWYPATLLFCSLHVPLSLWLNFAYMRDFTFYERTQTHTKARSLQIAFSYS